MFQSTSVDTTQNDIQKRLDESIALINSKQWYAAYILLSPLEKNCSDISVLYNLGLCYFHIDEFDKAISLFSQALAYCHAIPIINSPSLNQAQKIRQKFQQKEYNSDGYFYALTPTLVKIEPELVLQRLLRLLIEIYSQKSCWEDVLKLSRKLKNRYPELKKIK